MESPKNLELALAEPYSEVTPSPTKSLVEAILDLENPSWRLWAAFVSVAGAITKGASAPTLPQLEHVASRRSELEASSLTELQDLHAKLVGERTRAEEARRFYNKPEAKAKFGDWIHVDFWTIDDAVPLLLGRDPRVVNMATIARDLEKHRGTIAGASTPFTNLFAELQRRAERSHHMTATRELSPRQVARWGQSVLGEALPAALKSLLTADSNPALPRLDRPTPASDDSLKKTAVKRAALVAMAATWPLVESDLKHAHKNGL